MAKLEPEPEPEVKEPQSMKSEQEGKPRLKPLSFGIELEFLVGYQPYESANPKSLPGSRVNIKGLSDRLPGWGANKMFTDPVAIIQQDIVNTLVNAGFKAQVYESNDHTGQTDDVPPEKWVLSIDGSIVMTEEDSEYEFAAIEICSPAWFVCERSIKEAEAVIKLLKKTYYLVTNSTTGFHVHVGCGKEGFEFEHMRNLIAILWAYKHQLSSIHPPHRIMNDNYHRSMRKQSNYAKKRPMRHSMIDGMKYFLNLTDMQVLLKQATCLRRHGDYNFTNMITSTRGEPLRKTIEFRGHESTFDSDRVRNWILSVVVIVDWVRSASEFGRETLKLLAKKEMWEKIRNERDNKMEAAYGPILAERDFTIVHLLKFMRLFEPALFYHQRGLYKHNSRMDLDELIVHKK